MPRAGVVHGGGGYGGRTYGSRGAYYGPHRSYYRPYYGYGYPYRYGYPYYGYGYPYRSGFSIGIGVGFGYGYPYYGYPYYGYPYAYGGYPYAYGYPGGYVAYGGSAYGGIRIEGAVRNAEVYVDGGFAGIVDNFDGTFQRLQLEPGTHSVEIRAPGVPPLNYDVNVQPGQTMTLRPYVR